MFGVYASSVHLCSLCNTSKYVTRPYLSTCDCSHQTHVRQPGHANAPRHAQSVMSPECSNYHEGSELCKGIAEVLQKSKFLYPAYQSLPDTPLGGSRHLQFIFFKCKTALCSGKENVILTTANAPLWLEPVKDKFCISSQI